jgi:hypothetical protein
VYRASCKICVVVFRKLAKQGKVVDRSGILTLNDIDPGTVLEGMFAKKTKTSVGDAMTIAVVDTKNGKRIPMDLMVPERFETQCQEKLPCLLYYDGKKQTKKGKDAHDLRFIPIFDPRMFHESDEEEEDEDEKTEKDSAHPTTPVEKEVSPAKSCETCEEGRFCTGFCPLCGNHQPFNGSQCRCFGFC